jgi:hypothetical protein
MKTKDGKNSETPKPLGIRKCGMVQKMVIDPGITRAETMTLVGWLTNKREETYVIQNMPKPKLYTFIKINNTPCAYRNSKSSNSSKILFISDKKSCWNKVASCMGFTWTPFFHTTMKPITLH